MDTAAVTQLYLMYVVLPLWLLVGIVDWLCHRATHIETTSGPKESLIHLLMLVEVGIPVLMGLFLEINGLIILLMIGAWILHEITAHWDLRYALPRRKVTPTEQHVHNYLGAIPFMALSFILVLHWPQLLALVGMGPEPLRFAIRLKQPPLPPSYVWVLLAAIALLEVLPYLEELYRGLRAGRAKDFLPPLVGGS